jgi:hypothetical protein
MRPWLALAIASYSIASYFLERADGGDWANWNHGVGGLALLWYVRWYYKDQRDVVLTGFMQIYSTLALLLSAAVVSTGVYMFEVGQFGTQNGIFWVMAGFFVAGFEASGSGFRAAGRITLQPGVKRFPKRFEHRLILATTVAALVLSAYVLARYRGPVLAGVDRATFWLTMAPSYLSFVPTLVLQTFFFAAYYFLWMRRSGGSTRLPTAILFAYIVAAVMVLGEKFSAFTVFMNAWFVVLPGMMPAFKVKGRHLLVFAGVMFLLLVSVVVSYVLMGREAIFVLTRIALQAQVLWSVFDDTRHLGLWPEAWSCYFQCGQFDTGKDFISFAYMPHGLYRFYSSGGSQLSGFMPALPILTMGLVAALLVHLLVSFVLGFLQRKVVSAVSRENMVYAFLLFKLHLGLTLWWFAATESAVRGLVAVLLVIGLYRVCFPARATLPPTARPLSPSHP